MALRSNFACLVTPLLMVGLASACRGKTLGGTEVEPGEDAGTGATHGVSCVDFEVGPSDLSCGSDSDCALVRTGEVCSGQCLCGDSPVNAAAAARFQSETASLTLEGCPCAFPGEAHCLGGQCTLCGLGPNQPAGCGELGTTLADGGAVDGGGGADAATDGATQSGDTAGTLEDSGAIDGGAGADAATDGATQSGDSAGACSGTNFCACTNFCVSTCRCADGGCSFTQACEGAVCPNSCPSGEACAVQAGDVFMCSATCTPDGVDGQGSCPANMICQTVCP
jgi:hypothetical protein